MSEGLSANRLLAALDDDDRRAVEAALTPIDLQQGRVIYEPGDPIEHLHFVDDGVVSCVATLEDGRTVETLMIGREGLTGVIAVNLSRAAYTRNVVQITGASHRIDAARFRALAEERPGIRAAVGAYASVLQSELEQSAACNALHRAEQRFTKWLLRCHDRVRGDTFNLTQEYMASMLGSQRTTVNEAAQGLQKAGAIAYSRGRITVLDRAALERVACECYWAADTYRDSDPGRAVSAGRMVRG